MQHRKVVFAVNQCVLKDLKAMEQPAYVRDIDELLQAYSQTDATDFASFRDMWRAQHFTFIHEGRPKEMDQKAYQQILYSAALGHLGEDKPLSRQVAALYALYTLYETQPAQPKVLIYLSTDVMQMRALLRQIRGHQLADALQVMRSLVMRELCLYGTVTCSAPATVHRLSWLAEQSKTKIKRTQEKLLGAPTVRSHFQESLIETLPLAEVDKWAADYECARDKALTGSRALLVAGTEPGASSLGGEVREKAAEWDKERAALLARLPPPRPARAQQNVLAPVQQLPEAAGPQSEASTPPPEVPGQPQGGPPSLLASPSGPETLEQPLAEQRGEGEGQEADVARGVASGEQSAEGVVAGRRDAVTGEDMDIDAHPQSMPTFKTFDRESSEEGTETDNEEHEDEVAQIERELFGD